MLLPLLSFAAVALEPPTPDVAEPALPPEVRSVVEAAIASGDAAAVDAVVRFSIAAHPAAESEIRRLHTDFRSALARHEAAAAEAQRQQLASASMFEQWKGQVEIGGSRLTGTTDSLGVFIGANARRDGIDWSHRVSLRADIQETNGTRNVERIAADWQPRLGFGDRLYGFGIAQFERDPFAGYDARYAAGLGAGYSLVDASKVRLEVEGGAAWRRTDYVGLADRSTLAGRASFDLAWRLTDALALSQKGALTIDADNESAAATTALDTVLFGPLRLRLSYELRFENDLLRQQDTTSTASRATFVYSL